MLQSLVRQVLGLEIPRGSLEPMAGRPAWLGRRGFEAQTSEEDGNTRHPPPNGSARRGTLGSAMGEVLRELGPSVQRRSAHSLGRRGLAGTGSGGLSRAPPDLRFIRAPDSASRLCKGSNALSPRWPLCRHGCRGSRQPLSAPSSWCKHRGKPVCRSVN